MDDRRFDDLTRLTASGSRRDALKVLGGSAAGGLLGLFGIRRGSAQEAGVDCCPQTAPNLCDLHCVDLESDPDHCGACGNECRGNQVCRDGECVKPLRCREGLQECNGACVDLATDPGNCGSCDTSCNGGTCEQGVCTSTGECQPGTTQPCGSNVGACSPGTQTCLPDGTWGECTGGVGPQLELCNGIDDDCDGMVDNGFDLQTDPSHCGQCGNVCPDDTMICSQGRCECRSGENCGDVCVDILTDPNNCGGCGEYCGGGTCVEGLCASICGNGICEPDETCESCPLDCGTCDQPFCATADCDTGNPCTIDSCDEENRICVSEPLSAGTACDDNSVCTENNVCDGAGTCIGTPVGCIDLNPCTSDLCDPVLGCNHPPLADGTPCGENGEICRDGVCIESACTTNAECGVCGVCNGGTCGPATSGTVCRSAVGPCDMTETCDGTSLDCPQDQYAPSTTVCRPAMSDCDIAEYCTGTSVDCPADVFVADETPCDTNAICLNGQCISFTVCTPGATQQCGVSDVGVCQYGTMTCQQDGTWGVCEGAIYPEAETCDGLDNDCDGFTDNVDTEILRTDEANCGACFNACANGEICVDGQCAAA